MTETRNPIWERALAKGHCPEVSIRSVFLREYVDAALFMKRSGRGDIPIEAVIALVAFVRKDFEAPSATLVEGFCELHKRDRLTRMGEQLANEGEGLPGKRHAAPFDGVSHPGKRVPNRRAGMKVAVRVAPEELRNARFKALSGMSVEEADKRFSAELETVKARRPRTRRKLPRGLVVPFPGIGPVEPASGPLGS